MPRVQFVNQAKGISVTRDMPTPKRMSEIRYWLKEAQKWLPSIPKKIAESPNMIAHIDDWWVSSSSVDVKWIKFELENRIGERAQIVIDRSQKF